MASWSPEITVVHQMMRDNIVKANPTLSRIDWNNATGTLSQSIHRIPNVRIVSSLQLKISEIKNGSNSFLDRIKKVAMKTKIAQRKA